ncbi:GntR family transcriptional regulator [Streptomyces sp. NPDC050560]|uniref:GntR family transcriptional regulator n=1 Tax=Streptomyces sp. NPDC050560 TaxID=3365630 RepID=UPI00379D5A15
MTSSVYARLHEGIINGEYSAGESLVETALAAQFGISRTPVREALRRLEQDGLVERGSRGMQVSRRSPEEILEIYEVRIILETAAARSAAEKRTALDLMRLEQLHETMQSIPPDDPDRLATTNRKFHEVIWSMSHNATLIDLLKRLHAHLIRYRKTTLTYQNRWQTVLEEHSRLIEAIKEGDSERAARIAEHHMTGARNTRLLMYADDDGTGAADA